MTFSDFDFVSARQAFGLSLAEARLFADVSPLDPPAGLAERLRHGVVLAVAVDTEKARSEFLIAPLLGDLRMLLGGGFGLFSGVLFDVDADRGLTGRCDFLLSRSPIQSELTAPLVAVAEAKNDNVRHGYGQCISGMVAAREFNARAGTPTSAVYGVATTGTAWKFLRLAGTALTLDLDEYYIADPGRIMGILAHIITRG